VTRLQLAENRSSFDTIIAGGLVILASALGYGALYQSAPFALLFIVIAVAFVGSAFGIYTRQPLLYLLALGCTLTNCLFGIAVYYQGQRNYAIAES
jgi:hypothetical protein